MFPQLLWTVVLMLLVVLLQWHLLNDNISHTLRKLKHAVAVFELKETITKTPECWHALIRPCMPFLSVFLPDRPSSTFHTMDWHHMVKSCWEAFWVKSSVFPRDPSIRYFGQVFCHLDGFGRDKQPLKLLRGFAPNKLLILPTARIQNKCACRLTLMDSLKIWPPTRWCQSSSIFH